LFISTFAVSSAGFAQAPRLANVGGLFQRLALSSGFVWLSLRAADLYFSAGHDAPDPSRSQGRLPEA
jgi:hypothetical protein